MDGTPFHPGELEAQALAGAGSRGAGIRDLMPEQHRIFFGQLPLLFAALGDETGHPIATVLSGEPGFIRSPAPTTLSIRALPALDDPAALHLKPGQPIGLLGLEFPTRRRNRANGLITARDPGGFSVAVRQSFGNCAKYIQARTPQAVEHAAGGSTEIISQLDDAARALIRRSDTFFVASTSEVRKLGGLDISHRGGRPGFVGIDGEVLSVPDFAGNNYFNTLGNLLRDPRASLLFIDFENGAMLQLQGRVEIVWSGLEVTRLTGAERIWRLHVTSGWRRHAALPLHWSPPEPAATTLGTGIWA
ncbi:pyridoxamine 5'-phosphate oxidase family protein [Bosea sp. 685]|uniref:pyridoxamine 5'-phosphate oxidase family protein n=1 Tax=Bosea sp. 685 TaxID=3080057 RepID=UPI0028937190|nr:pyridoxamine 5'-phosphate oxidase family protein [Bosea sp. 685]WNJ92114.1 pyridoxamine 5'-phosphate oxidase family protein [Bosea sp. 685]